MQINRETLSPTKTKLTIVAEQTELDNIKAHVLKDLAGNVKVQGFRQGKAPANLIEKNVDSAVLQSQFLDHAINDLYVDAAQQSALRPVSQPQINVTKFVPFTALEFAAEVEIVGEIKLGDFKKVKVTADKVEVTTKDVNEVIDRLLDRAAEKKLAQRAAKNGDEVTIDFAGTDAKTKEPIDGADGKEYPLTLGSKAFIPGFEEELVGLKAGDKKEFTLTFPEDYGAKALQKKKVTFAVTVSKVNELVKPKLDDAFAASTGPFKTVAELKADIKKQLQTEKEQEAQRRFDNELLQQIAEKSEVAIPEALVNEEIDRIEEEEKRNIVYQGQTWEEHLADEGVTAEGHREKNREGAELRVKAGLVLGEIAEREGISVTPEELEVRLMLLQNQYPDAAMQAELAKPENRRDIQSRMLTEKTLDKLREYAAAK